MATNKELEILVKKLDERLNRVQRTNSELRDELIILKNNYSTLVKEMSVRLEVIHNRFQSS
mgnify:CR=1 FL=1|tara:strand:- start:31 stop:213 length:183 start_codon:yes stop_codon:yes gene_type:complete